MVWVNKNSRYLLILLLLSQPSFADEEPPSLELFEFLAEWQDEEGRWIDPLAFAANEEEALTDDEEEANSHD